MMIIELLNRKNNDYNVALCLIYEAIAAMLMRREETGKVILILLHIEERTLLHKKSKLIFLVHMYNIPSKFPNNLIPTNEIFFTRPSAPNNSFSLVMIGSFQVTRFQ